MNTTRILRTITGGIEQLARASGRSACAALLAITVTHSAFAASGLGVGLQADTLSLTEGSGVAMVKVFAIGWDQNDSRQFSVQLTGVNWSELDPAYSPPTTVSFNTNNRTNTFTIRARSDTESESTETVTISIVEPAPPNPNNWGCEFSGYACSLSFSVFNTDVPEVSFLNTNSSVSEAVGGNVTVRLSFAPASPVTVQWRILNSSTATYSTDYSTSPSASGNPRSGSLTFAAGDTEEIIALLQVNDTLDEGNEDVRFQLASATGAVLGVRTNHVLTIVDDDAPPTVSFTSSTSSANEQNVTHNIQVSLSGASSQTVSVNWAIAGGTATRGLNQDYNSAASGTLNITPPATSANISLTIYEDTIEEANEMVIINLSSPVNAALGSTTQHTFTINDDDVTVFFPSPATNVAENFGQLAVPVRLSRPQATTFTVQAWETNRTTSATVGNDFTVVSRTVTFSAGATQAFVYVNITNDTLDEYDDIIDLNLVNPSSGTIGAFSLTRVVVLDDDTPPTAQFSFSAATISESDPDSWFIDIVLSAPSDRGVIVFFATSGAAMEDQDYTILDPAVHSVYFAEGETNKWIELRTIDDTVYEAGETATFTIYDVENAVRGVRTNYNLRINDNDAAPRASFVSGSSSTNENAGTAMVPVRLSAPAGVDTFVNLSVTGGTASNGVDYALGSTTVTFFAGETQKVASISLVNDAIDEPNETITLRLSPGGLIIGGPTGIGVTGTTNHTFTILDEDPLPVLFFTRGVSQVTEGTSTNIELQLTRQSAHVVTATIAPITNNTSPSDYTLSTIYATFQPGQTSVVLSITANNDANVEGDEFTVLGFNSLLHATFGVPRTNLVWLLDTDTVAIQPEPAEAIAINPGHKVQFRKATNVFIRNINEAYSLLLSPPSNANVDFDVFDDGIPVINYVDAATDPTPRGSFGNDRDIHSVTGTPTFATGPVDDFAMRSSGYIFIGTPGNWRFTVRSDDGFRLRMGASNAVVMEFPGGRAAADSEVSVQVPVVGLYRYELLYFEGFGGAEVEFFARRGVEGPNLNRLVGTNGLFVYQDIDLPIAINPEPFGFVAGPSGHSVEFRRAGFSVTNVTAADALLALATTSSSVLAVATDHGVATINYLDDGPDGPFVTGNRAVATPPLMASKGTFSASGDQNYAMRAAGYIYIPQPGTWSFYVHSDDGFRLRMGRPLIDVAVYSTGRAAAETATRIDAPSAGYYAYELIYFENTGGAEVEFYGAGEGQTTAKLVGDPTGVFQVVQNGIVLPPMLEIHRAGSQVVLSWSSEYQGYTLQRSTTVSGASWLPVTPTPVLFGDRWVVTNSPTAATRRFYRLFLP